MLYCCHVFLSWAHFLKSALLLLPLELVTTFHIYIWEQQSDGSYDNVKTYTSGLIDTNTAASYRRITYSGTPGVKYYATVVLYAKDSDGSEKLYSSTNVITA